MGLPVATLSWSMELTSSGRLLAWLGPAIRGTLAWAVKEAVCRWSPAERDTLYRTCKGCEYVGQCVYGCTFEAEAPRRSPAPSGLADGQRAVTLRPFFPAPERAAPGDRVPLWMTFVGERAVAAGETIGKLLSRPNRTFVLGEDRVGFRLVPRCAEAESAAKRERVEAEDLPGGPRVCPGRAPSLRLELLSPLFLQQSDYPRAKPRRVFQPTFGQLARASLRTVGRAFAGLAPGELEGRVDFAALKTLAESVPTQAASWERFEQWHYSNRCDQTYLLRGVIGSAVFCDVPLCLVPWLVWGGRLGVGELRVAGAGAWRVHLGNEGGL